jgi:hypothetical protein
LSRFDAGKCPLGADSLIEANPADPADPGVRERAEPLRYGNAMKTSPSLGFVGCSLTSRSHGGLTTQ